MRLRTNITSEEVACKCGCGFNEVSPSVLDIVQDVREHFDRPVTIHSAARCYMHNVEINGSITSKHLPEGITNLARAIDFHIDGVKPNAVYVYLIGKYPNSLGIGLYDTFVHVDDKMAKARRWNNSSK